MQKVIVSIRKERDFDVKSKKIEAECFDLLGKKIEVSTITCYEMEGDLGDVKSMVESYIVDPVIEVYSIHSSIDEIIKSYKGNLSVVISFRKGVTNPDDEIILSSLKRVLGGRIKKFRTIMVYIFRNINLEEAELISKKILANELIHEVSIFASNF